MEKRVGGKLKPILQLTGPRVKPEHNISNNATSKSFKRFSIMKGNEQQSSMLLTAMRHKREYIKANEDLKSLRELARKQSAINNESWLNLQKKQLDLKETFQNYAEFIEDNKAKRVRDREKIEFIKDKMKKTRIVELMDEMETKYKYMMDIKDKFEAKIKMDRIYNDYLSDIVDVSAGRYANPAAIIKRYSSLLDAKDEVMAKKMAIITGYDEIKEKMTNLRTKHSMNLMTMTMATVKLTSRHDAAVTRALKFEGVLQTVRNELQRRYNEILNVRGSIWDIYSELFKRFQMHCNPYTDVQPLPKDDVEQQMVFIKSSLRQLNEITRTTRPSRLSNKFLIKWMPTSYKEAISFQTDMSSMLQARSSMVKTRATTTKLSFCINKNSEIEVDSVKHSESSGWAMQENRILATVVMQPRDIKAVDPLTLDPAYLKAWVPSANHPGEGSVLHLLHAVKEEIPLSNHLEVARNDFDM